MSMTEAPLIAEERDETHLAGRPVMERRRTMVGGDPAFRMVQTVWFFLGLVEGFIGLRVILHAAAANAVGFVDFINAVSGPLVAPFEGITPDYVHRANVVEIGSLIAMLVYFIAGYLAVKLVRIASTPRPGAEPPPRTYTTTTYR
jgi:YGGT family